MASALFNVNASSAQQAHVVDFGSAINYTLVNSAGVNSVEYTIVGVSHAGLTIPAIVLAGAVGAASHNMILSPGADRAFMVECVVNGGFDASGRADPALRCRRVIGTTAYGDIVPLVAGETTERDASVGWVNAVNQQITKTYLRPIEVIGVHGETVSGHAVAAETFGKLPGTFTAGATSGGFTLATTACEVSFAQTWNAYVHVSAVVAAVYSSSSSATLSLAVSVNGTPTAARALFALDSATVPTVVSITDVVAVNPGDEIAVGILGGEDPESMDILSAVATFTAYAADVS